LTGDTAQADAASCVPVLDARACQYAVHIGAIRNRIRECCWPSGVGYTTVEVSHHSLGTDYTSFSAFFYLYKREREYIYYICISKNKDLSICQLFNNIFLLQ